MAWQRSARKTGNDQAAILVDPRWHGSRWDVADLGEELSQRLTTQLAADQLVVDHYRVGYHWAFELPVSSRPERLPRNIGSVTEYPWLIWLSWELLERWDTFGAAWNLRGDNAARKLWQSELAALQGWEHFRNRPDEVGLTTGHLAAALAVGLHVQEWEPVPRRRAEAAAQQLLEQDIPHWFETTWSGAGSLHNIPMIVLCSIAALARVVDHPSAHRWHERAVTAVEDWFAARRSRHHSEQSAYNGYLLDSVTLWLEIEIGVNGSTPLLTRWRRELLDVCHEWAQLSVPGRADLAFPLGDVEAEMTMWLSCVARIAGWYGADPGAGDGSGATWLLQRCAPERLPAAALGRCLRGDISEAANAPATGVQELPAALTLRHGWDFEEPAVAVGLSRADVGHLHRDGGHVILGWRGRCWITDPGYQQYVAGLERDYSTGPEAHNGPVVAGRKQDLRRPRLLGTDPVVIDLTDCYSDLAEETEIRRTVDLVGDRLLIHDAVAPAKTALTTHWLAGAGLAWAFVNGWIRLSDGGAAIWFGTGTPTHQELLHPDAAVRHEGSRGPVGFWHEGTAGMRRWQCVLDRMNGWTAPKWSLEPEPNP